MIYQNSNRFFFVSLGIHILLLLILIFSFHWSGKMPVLENTDNGKIINAMVVQTFDTPQKTTTAPRLQQHSPVKPTPPPPPPKIVKPIEKKSIPVKPKVVEVKHPKTDAIPLLKQKKLKEKQEKDLLADLEKDVKRQQKKVKQKNIEAALEMEMKEQAEKALQQELLNENKKISSAKAQKVQGIVDKYKALIQQAISQEWLIPDGADKKSSCQLLIRVAPGGAVLDVQVSKGSGDVALDRSARAAVFKASPLPVPKDHDAFEPFKEFVLTVRPENVLRNDSIAG